MRALFLVRKEGGKHHVVRDWRRCIYRTTADPRQGLPLDESRPLWERIALMNYWFPSNQEVARDTCLNLIFDDPGQALSHWRKIKLQRGLVRHPNPVISATACCVLVTEGWGLDECVAQLPATIVTAHGDVPLLGPWPR